MRTDGCRAAQLGYLPRTSASLQKDVETGPRDALELVILFALEQQNVRLRSCAFIRKLGRSFDKSPASRRRTVTQIVLPSRALPDAEASPLVLIREPVRREVLDQLSETPFSSSGL